MADADLVRLRRACRLEADRTKHERARYPNGACASTWCTDVALAIAVLEDFNVDTAVRWLLLPSRRGAPVRRGTTAEDARTYVEERLLAEDPEVLAVLTEPGASRLNAHGLLVARSFVADRGLSTWVGDRARAAGMPVRSAAAAAQFAAMTGQLDPESEAPARYGSRGSTSSGHWQCNFVRRWRERVGCVRWGRIRPRDPVTQEEKREKASAPERTADARCGHPRCDAFRPRADRPFRENGAGIRYRNSARFPGRILRPFSGADLGASKLPSFSRRNFPGRIPVRF